MRTAARLIGRLTLLVSSSLLPGTHALAQNAAEEEANRQVARQISDSIVRRIAQAVLPIPGMPQEGDFINAWVTPSYTNLSFDPGFDGFAGDFDTHIYQILGGADKRFGDLYAGVSLGYTRVESDFSGVHIPDISPYLAYVFSPNLFGTVIVGYARSQVDDIDIGAFELTSNDSNSAFTDESVTGALPIDSWVFRGKAGHRFRYTVQEDDIDLPAFIEVDDDAIVNTLYLGGEAGYRFGALFPYARFSVEHFIPDRGEDSDSVFIGAGATYTVSEVFSVGASYQHELNQDDVEYHQGVLEFRFRL